MPFTLTHIKLADKAGHVIMLEVFGKYFLRESSLVKHMEAVPTLQRIKRKTLN